MEAIAHEAVVKETHVHREYKALAILVQLVCYFEDDKIVAYGVETTIGGKDDTMKAHRIEWAPAAWLEAIEAFRNEVRFFI